MPKSQTPFIWWLEDCLPFDGLPLQDTTKKQISSWIVFFNQGGGMTVARNQKADKALQLRSKTLPLNDSFLLLRWPNSSCSFFNPLGPIEIGSMQVVHKKGNTQNV